MVQGRFSLGYSRSRGFRVARATVGSVRASSTVGSRGRVLRQSRGPEIKGKAVLRRAVPSSAAPSPIRPCRSRTALALRT